MSENICKNSQLRNLICKDKKYVISFLLKKAGTFLLEIMNFITKTQNKISYN